jgi:hypothetical protein
MTLGDWLILALEVSVIAFGAYRHFRAHYVGRNYARLVAGTDYAFNITQRGA